METTKSQGRNFLLLAIYAFRCGDAEPWTTEWDTLMYYFEKDCYEYAYDLLSSKDYTDEEINKIIDTPAWYEMYINYLAMYLTD